MFDAAENDHNHILTAPKKFGVYIVPKSHVTWSRDLTEFLTENITESWIGQQKWLNTEIFYWKL